MKDFEKELMSVVDDFEADYGISGVLEELFPGMSLGELVVDMYNSGMIPDDVMEKFLEQ